MLDFDASLVYMFSEPNIKPPVTVEDRHCYLVALAVLVGDFLGFVLAIAKLAQW